MVIHPNAQGMATRPGTLRPSLTREEIVVLGTCAAFGAGLALLQAAGVF